MSKTTHAPDAPVAQRAANLPQAGVTLVVRSDETLQVQIRKALTAIMTRNRRGYCDTELYTLTTGYHTSTVRGERERMVDDGIIRPCGKVQFQDRAHNGFELTPRGQRLNAKERAMELAMMGLSRRIECSQDNSRELGKRYRTFKAIRNAAHRRRAAAAAG